MAETAEAVDSVVEGLAADSAAAGWAAAGSAAADWEAAGLVAEMAGADSEVAETGAEETGVEETVEDLEPADLEVAGSVAGLEAAGLAAAGLAAVDSEAAETAGGLEPVDSEAADSAAEKVAADWEVAAAAADLAAADLEGVGSGAGLCNTRVRLLGNPDPRQYMPVPSSSGPRSRPGHGRSRLSTLRPRTACSRTSFQSSWGTMRGLRARGSSWRCRRAGCGSCRCGRRSTGCDRRTPSRGPSTGTFAPGGPAGTAAAGWEGRGCRAAAHWAAAETAAAGWEAAGSAARRVAGSAAAETAAAGLVLAESAVVARAPAIQATVPWVAAPLGMAGATLAERACIPHEQGDDSVRSCNHGLRTATRAPCPCSPDQCATTQFHSRTTPSGQKP